MVGGGACLPVVREGRGGGGGVGGGFGGGGGGGRGGRGKSRRREANLRLKQNARQERVQTLRINPGYFPGLPGMALSELTPAPFNPNSCLFPSTPPFSHPALHPFLGLCLCHSGHLHILFSPILILCLSAQTSAPGEPCPKPYHRQDLPQF